MNLTQLFQLKMDILQSGNKTVNTNTVLVLLDSHISALSVKDEHCHSEESKTLQRAFTEPTRIDRIHPKSREEVLKSYRGGVKNGT